MKEHNTKGIIKEIDSNIFLLRLSKEFYEKDAVMRAAYKFTHKCIVLIEPMEEGFVGVFFKPKTGQSIKDIPELLEDYCNEVLDQQVRLDLERKFGNLRDIIYTHAFLPILTKEEEGEDKGE